jgi:hypothetical protein
VGKLLNYNSISLCHGELTATKQSGRAIPRLKINGLIHMQRREAIMCFYKGLPKPTRLGLRTGTFVTKLPENHNNFALNTAMNFPPTGNTLTLAWVR